MDLKLENRTCTVASFPLSNFQIADLIVVITTLSNVLHD